MVDAFAAFMQKLLEMAKRGEPIESQQKLLSLWVEVADAEFLKLFHSEHYAAVQSRYVNSSMALRRQQRELIEVLLRMNDMPTQSALDEAHHNIFLLRKEVKALQKAVHALTTAAEQRTAPAKAATPSTPAKRPRRAKPSPPPTQAVSTSEEGA
jgi:class III poly(R)-hydroxyalkanoic acid synthase PhaE subunit